MHAYDVHYVDYTCTSCVVVTVLVTKGDVSIVDNMLTYIDL